MEFVHALQQVKPFELSCDFLTDEEKEQIKGFVGQLSSSCDPSNPTMLKISKKFKEVCEIDLWKNILE